MTASLQSPAKIAFKNVDPQSAPAFGVMQVTGSVVENGVTFLTCAQVGSTLSREFAVNGPSAVRSGDKGICFRQGDLQVAYDSGSPQPGDGWGARAGQWTLSKGYPSIISVHGLQNTANHVLFGKVSQLRTVLGVPASDMAPLNGSGLPGSGSVTVWIWNGTDFVVSSPAMTFTGYNYAGVPLQAGKLAEFVEADGLFIHRAPENFIYSATAAADVADGASGNFTLSDARVVSAQNISGSTIHNGDPAGVFEDLNLKSYFALKAGTGATLVRFELTADLVYGTVPGGTNARIVTYGGGAYTAAGAAITVYDFTRFSGYGSWAGKYDASVTPKGYQGWAILKSDSTSYEVVWMEQKAQLIAVRLYQQLTTGMSNVANCTVTAFWNGRDPDPGAGGVTLYNLATDYSGVYKFSGDANALGYAVWNEKTGVYKIIALEGDGRRWQLFKNTSGYTVPACGVVHVMDTSSDNGGHTQSRMVLKTERPTTTFARNYAINGYADVPNSSIGVCCTTEGPVEAIYDSLTPANGETWGPKPGQFTLSKGFPGCAVLGACSANGTLAVVTQEPILQLLVKTTADVSNNASTTSYTIMVGTQGSEADGGWTNVPPLWNRTGATFKSGNFALANWINNGWELAPLASGGGVLRGTLGGTLTSATASVTISGVTGVGSANNPMGFAGNNGDKVFVSNVSGAWEIIGVQQHVYTEVTAVTVDGTNLHVTSRDFVGMANAAGSTTDTAWSTIATSFTFVADVFLSGLDIKETKKTGYGLGAPTSSADTLVVPGTNCP